MADEDRKWKFATAAAASAVFELRHAGYDVVLCQDVYAMWYLGNQVSRDLVTFDAASRYYWAEFAP